MCGVRCQVHFHNFALNHQWSATMKQDSQNPRHGHRGMLCCNEQCRDKTRKATYGRGYCKNLPALFAFLWSAGLLIPKWRPKYTITICAKVLPHGELACRDASRVVARSRDALRCHLQRQQDGRRTPLLALWEPLPQPDLASPRAVAGSPAASPGRACDPGRSHKTLPMQIW